MKARDFTDIAAASAYVTGLLRAHYACALFGRAKRPGEFDVLTIPGGFRITVFPHPGGRA